MHELDALLAREPTSATWSALVAWFDARIGFNLPLADAVARAQARLAAWPPTVARPLPYRWIFRLCDADVFPPAGLANALCLGDRWALHPGVSITAFANLSPRRLARLMEAAELTGLRWLDVSCQTDGHAHSPGTMLYHVESLAEFLGAPIFAGLVGLDLAYTGIDVDGVAQILAQHPALRVLALGAGDGDCLGDDLPRLLAIPGLARLEHLELHRIGAQADETRALLACPQLAGLRFLGWPVERAWLSECGLGPDEFAARLAASPLAAEVKTWLAGQYAERDGFVVEAACFGAMFPGEPGAPFDMLNDDE